MKHQFFRSVSIAALVACGSSLSAQDKAVAVLAKDGSCYELALNQVDRINFNPSHIEIVSAADGTKAMSYTDIDRILIGSEIAGIDEVTANGDIAVWPTVTTGIFNISGAGEGTPVKVFDLSGTLIYSTEYTGNRLSIDISGARSGMLIVCIGNRSVKLIKK